MSHPLRAALAVLTLVFPVLASAHEHQSFRINGKIYEFTVGSLNEPVAVDDKSGVDLSVMLAAGEHGHDDAAAEEEAGTPVLGLDKTLKVEVSAAGKTRTFDLAPQYGKPGAYRAIFIPTVQTTLTYRVFGTIDGVNVDLSFTCNPAGHPQTPADDTEKEMSPGVVRVGKTGAFGCPVGKADLGFPEPSAEIAALAANPSTSAAEALGGAGVALGVAALALSILAWRRSAR